MILSDFHRQGFRTLDFIAGNSNGRHVSTDEEAEISVTKRSLTLRQVRVCPLLQRRRGTRDAEERNADVCGGADDIITLRF